MFIYIVKRKYKQNLLQSFYNRIPFRVNSKLVVKVLDNKGANNK